MHLFRRSKVKKAAYDHTKDIKLDSLRSALEALERSQSIAKRVQAKKLEMVELEENLILVREEELKSAAPVAPPAVVQKPMLKPMPKVKPKPKPMPKPMPMPSNSGDNSIPVAPPVLSLPHKNAAKIAVKPVEVNHWSKGTGYGNNNRSTAASWNIDSYLQQKQVQDQKLAEHVSDIRKALAGYKTKSTWAAECQTAAYHEMEHSCLLPFLHNQLQADSIVEMHTRKALYKAVFYLCSALTEFPAFNGLFVVPCFVSGGDNLKSVLLSLKAQADQVRMQESKLMAKGAKIANKEKPEDDVLEMMVQVGKSMDKIKDVVPGEATTETAAMVAEQIEREVAAKIAADNSNDDSDSDETATATTVTTMTTMAEEKKQEAAGTTEQDYIKALQPLQVDETDTFEFHKYSGDAVILTRPYVRRVTTELNDLAKSLPLTMASSVFLRWHEAKMGLIQMMIAAPDDTPYAGGLFIFDISLGSQYPQAAPAVNLLTTGKGSVRFNPNLYNCGKVCLSLLGTWGGDKSEQWQPNTSTLLQLAISIQSLIFVEEPYFNEPGYETNIGKPTGITASDNYNRNIEQQTVRWAMLDLIKNPPKCWEAVIRNHFFYKKDRILQGCQKWCQKPQREALKKLVDELKVELERVLPAPQS